MNRWARDEKAQCVCGVCSVRTWNESSRQSSSTRACNSHGCTRQRRGGPTGSERRREGGMQGKGMGEGGQAGQARQERKCHPQAQTSTHRRERGRQLSDFNAVRKSRRPHTHTHTHTHAHMRSAPRHGNLAYAAHESNDLRLSLVHGCKTPAPAISAFRPPSARAFPAVSLPFLQPGGDFPPPFF